MKTLKIKMRTAIALGIPSLYRAMSYRLGLRLGMNPVQRLHVTTPEPPFFFQPEILQQGELSDVLWNEEASYFGWFRTRLDGKPPNWHMNPFSGKVISKTLRPWWKISDFDAEAGDIKAIWEASRFDWVLAHALQGLAGKDMAIDRLNSWLGDWCQNNPPYLGPNWKCGQEASIRVMHLAIAAVLLNQNNSPQSALLDLIRVHLQRIAPTIRYAIAQNNNHGTSEAAALFIGGSWLHKQTGEKQAAKWEKIGLHWLENRVQHLIADDGSFSQYSVNYHRLLLDTLSIAEVWRLNIGREEFSINFKSRCQSAVKWLHAFIDPETGDAPNLGSNDGAHLLALNVLDFRDYRPSVQLAAALYLKEAAFHEGPWNETLRRLDISIPKNHIIKSGSRLFDKGGYSRLCSGKVRIFTRYPRFRFRPNHADALHLDVWIGSVNVLRDAGTYSYAAPQEEREYFSGTAGHNTVQFDDRDQMPRLSRFLFGEWLKMQPPELPHQEETHFSVGYHDWMGASHKRKVILEDYRLLVEDWVSGFRRKAVLRWRLMPGEWEKKDGSWCLGSIVLRVQANMPISRIELVEGWESRYYLKRDSIPVLEVEANRPGHFQTELTWSSPAHSN